MRKAPTVIPSRNLEWSNAVRAFTPRTAAFTVTASKCAPITRLTISSANGEPAAAHRAITSSSGQYLSGRCAWARTSRISAHGHLRDRRVLHRLELLLLERRLREEPVLRHHQHRRAVHHLQVLQLENKVLLLQLMVRHLHQLVRPRLHQQVLKLRRPQQKVLRHPELRQQQLP
jgi:hypothetical protein